MAIDYALALGVDAIWERVDELGERLRGQLAALDGVEVHDLGEQRCGIVSLTVAGETPQDLQARLLADGVNTSVSLMAHTRIDMERRRLDTMLRASVHYYNTDAELDRFVELLAV